MKTIVTLLVLIGGTCMAAENMKPLDFKAGDAELIQVETDSGEISLEAVEGQSIKVEVTGEYDVSKCSISAAVSDSRLLATAKGKFWRGGGCKAGFRVTAPAGKKLVLRTGAGKINVAGFSSGADASSGAGAIVFKAVSGPINVKSAAGPVSGDIYSEELTAGTGAGSIDLSWNKIPQTGKVDIKTGAGSTTLSFPAGTKVHVVHTSGAGSMSNELGDDPAAQVSIFVKSGAGGLKIKKS